MALAGKTIAFTGEMVGMTRKQAAAIAQAAGATVGSATSKNVQYLFAGNGATPHKTMKAQQNGVQVLAAPQFNQWTQGIKAPVAAPVMAAPVQTYAPVQTGNLSGKTVAFCGQFTEKPLAQMMGTAQAAGATVTSTVDANTNMLVVGKAPGPIAYQARTQGVHTVSESQFSRITRNAPVQTYQAPAPVAAPAQVRAPRGRRPRSASPAPAQTFAAPIQAPAPVIEAPVQTYEAPAGAMPWETEAVAAPVAQTFAPVAQTFAPAPVVEAPIAYEAPEGPMPWETEVVGEVAPVAQTFAPAPVVRAPRAKKVAVQAPVQTYAAPAPVAPVAAAPVAQTGAVQLAGQNVVFTGALQVNRVVAATMASKAGAICGSSLSGKTNLLVCGANAGEKMAKAQAMGVRCISEAEFVGACRF